MIGIVVTCRTPKLKGSTAVPVDPLKRQVYARHGRELMGCKSPVRESESVHTNGCYHKCEPKARAYPGRDPGNRNRIQGSVSGRVGTTQQNTQVQGIG